MPFTSFNIRRIALAYLAIECLVLWGFWMWVWIDGRAILRFVESGHEKTLEGFVLADQVVLALAALATGWGLAANRIWVRSVAWMHAGAALYATTTAIGAGYVGVLTTTSVILMAPLGPVAVCVAIVAGNRRAEP